MVMERSDSDSRLLFVSPFQIDTPTRLILAHSFNSRSFVCTVLLVSVIERYTFSHWSALICLFTAIIRFCPGQSLRTCQGIIVCLIFGIHAKTFCRQHVILRKSSSRSCYWLFCIFLLITTWLENFHRLNLFFVLYIYRVSIRCFSSTSTLVIAFLESVLKTISLFFMLSFYCMVALTIACRSREFWNEALCEAARLQQTARTR